MAQSIQTTNSDATRSESADELRITVFGASGLPRISLFHGDPKAFVTLRVLDQTWSTDVAARSKNPRWEKEFDLRGDNSSILKIELKILRRRFGSSHSEQLVGAVEIRFEELREKQKQAQYEDNDYATFDLQMDSSFKPQPSISIRIHRSLTAPKTVLETARVHLSSARDDIQGMRIGLALPTLPTGTSDAGSSAQDAVQAIASAKEVKAFYETTLASVEVFVKMVDAIADIHPYAKAAWTALSAGYKIAVAQKDRDDALSELLESMSTALDQVCRFDKIAQHELDKSVISQVAKKTNECALFIEKYCETKRFASRAVKNAFSNAGEEIARFKKDFDLLRKNLLTGAILSLTEGLSGVNEDVYKISEGMKDIARNVDRAAQEAILAKLPYAAGASWSPTNGCLAGTREALIEEIMDWIRGSSASGGAEILCLTGVAGSGKTAIAHTIAQRCHSEGILASSFFFNREFEERHHPAKLLSTMARDLARYPDICDHLSSVLEEDQSLATASLSRQFTPLIAEPCRRHTFNTSLALVLDALDEVHNPPDVLEIFRDDVPKLPQAFRLFITSREMEYIDIYLSRSPHVCLRTIDLDERVNLDDLCAYIHWRFGGIAEKRGLGSTWPDQRLKDVVISKAQGLFQWAVAVFQTMECAYDPAGVLEGLLTGLQTGLSPEEKMDEIYSKILQGYNWNEVGFKRDYDLVVGAILAAKSPLSASALQILHPGILNISNLLSRLGALLTGWRDPSQPVRILHLSLRDFLTVRTPNNAPFYICEKDHGQRLGILTLTFLNKSLKRDTPGVGYLGSDSPGIPATSKNQVPEELWYACEFWTTHVLEFEAPAPTELVEPLRDFMSAQSISWVEICASIDTFRGFQQIGTWIRSAFHEEISLMDSESNSRLGDALVDISERLSYMDRREEALSAIQEAVALYRQLAQDCPATFNPDLAGSLNNLSNRLSELGQREGALAASREAVALYRQLTNDCPAVFNPELASTLHNLSIRLSDLGQREKALAASQEAVALYQQLTKDRPVVFNPELATSLNNLSSQLSDLGQQEDALAASRESVVLYRQLAKSRPAAFNPDLANSLNNLSLRLSDLGQREEAFAASQESVVLYRQLANDRPAAFNPYLAESLNNLANGLSYLRQQEEALAAIQESVRLYRQLAKDRPAAFNHHLAGFLYNSSLRLTDLDRREEAVAAAKEAVALFRPLASGIPAVYESWLSNSLWQLSIALRDLSHEGEAVEAKRESDMLKSTQVPNA
ncbi:hypothetical protein BOTBODRAFT_177852 [Botryobasidium botryosum FD-172 SS1]|uniref:C2 domain-containing protein n=1 Tax=Botryobasidium botryosum (strain FD-172 SS1) TaxID=930990 RepID=A0A067M5F1_BOTB1|nr:hypothetical protein BOTBODRAFT_177852 [Botryobasidium botryosum FD-172 SS1]